VVYQHTFDPVFLLSKAFPSNSEGQGQYSSSQSEPSTGGVQRNPLWLPTQCVCSSNEKLLFDVAVQTFLSSHHFTSHLHSSPKAFVEFSINGNDNGRAKRQRILHKRPV